MQLNQIGKETGGSKANVLSGVSNLAAHKSRSAG